VRKKKPSIDRSNPPYIITETNQQTYADIIEPPIGYRIPFPNNDEPSEKDLLRMVSLGERWSWLLPDAQVGSAGERQHRAVFTPLDSANWDTVICMLKVTVISTADRLRQVVSIIGARLVEGTRYLVDSCDTEKLTIRFNTYGSIRSIHYMRDTGFALYNPSDYPDGIIYNVMRPNVYSLIMKYNFANGTNKNDTIFIERRFKFADIVHQKQNRVLFVNNSKSNNGYDFRAYDWYINDGYNGITKICDQCGQYYVSDDELEPNAQYRVEMTTAEGKTIGTCIGAINTLRNAATELRVYPNPAHGTITIENLQYESDRFVKIYNSSGSLVQNYQVGNATETLDVTSLSPGIYTIQNNERTKNIVIR
jgi:hypothetical protein